MSKLIYVGDGAFIPGVPARDLTEQEAKDYAQAIQDAQNAGQVIYKETPRPQKKESDEK